MLLRRPLGPGLERLKANALCSQRSRIIGHHFFITASSSVTSIGIFSIHMTGIRRRLSMRPLARRQSQRTLSRKQPSRTLSHPTKPTLFAKPKSGLETFQLMPWKIREAGLRERRWFAAGVWAREQSFPVHSITTIQEHSHCECQAEPWPWACDKILHFAVWSCGKILSFLS